jgi:Tfp pilus assembly protein PilZ
VPRLPPSENLLRRLRVALVRSAVLSVDGREEQVLAVDLGLNGLFVERTPPLPDQTEVTLRFSLPGNTLVIEARGRVAWSRPAAQSPSRPAGLGIEFTHLAEEDVKRVREFLLDHYARAPRARQFTRDWSQGRR